MRLASVLVIHISNIVPLAEPRAGISRCHDHFPWVPVWPNRVGCLCSGPDLAVVVCASLHCSHMHSHCVRPALCIPPHATLSLRYPKGSLGCYVLPKALWG
jgi:hypothetical protein